MSTAEECFKATQNDFTNIKETIKKETLTLFNNLNENIRDKINYIGISIYKKETDLYEVYYSLSIYRNKHNSLSISENDFSGFTFNEITGFDCDQESIKQKDHSYLSLFFDDIVLTENESKYCSSIIELGDYAIQIYMIFKSYPSGAEINNINETISSYKDNVPFKCIPHSNIKLRLKQGIKKLYNEYVLIVDLVRSSERMEPAHLNMDAVLTSNLIYKIKAKAGIANFKTINHTGDGFIFLYRGEKDNIENDIKLLIQELSNVMNDFHNFLEGLNDVARSYKLRAILSLCQTIFEIDYINSIDKKLYFSSELDQTFEKMFKIKSVESGLFNRNTQLNFILMIDNNIVVNQYVPDNTKILYSNEGKKD